MEPQALRRRRQRCSLLGLLIAGVLAVPAMAFDRPNVWLSPTVDSPDMLTLFRDPAAWADVRRDVGVFKFVSANLDLRGNATTYPYTALRQVNAFAQLRAWGVRIAAEEGAIKPFDCFGTQTARRTISHIANVAAAGAALQLVAMDEPWLSGSQACALELSEIAKRTAGYATAVRTSHEAGASAGGVAIGDIEPYPAMPTPTFIAWIKALEASGFKPAFEHLDIGLHFLDVHPEIRMTDDLRALARFFRAEGVPLGVIFHSGYDPENSDRVNYDHVIDMARRVKAAIGRPDQAIFQSWVTRSSVTCPRPTAACMKQPCTAGDPPYCGKKSVPLNLPDHGAGVFSQTRLVRDVLAILDAR